eukprot:365829-Chlamydomonas_euryale.AAC.6
MRHEATRLTASDRLEIGAANAPRCRPKQTVGGNEATTRGAKETTGRWRGIPAGYTRQHHPDAYL